MLHRLLPLLHDNRPMKSIIESNYNRRLVKYVLEDSQIRKILFSSFPYSLVLSDIWVKKMRRNYSTDSQILNLLDKAVKDFNLTFEIINSELTKPAFV